MSLLSFGLIHTHIYLMENIKSLRNIHYMFEGVRSLGLGCSRRTFSVIVLSMCLLYPCDEMAYHR